MHPLTGAPLALVTGASSGIGEAFARELSGRGYELVLVARDRARLRSLAQSLPRPSHVLDVDLTDPIGLAEVEEFIEHGPVSLRLVVNSAGTARYGLFYDQDPHWLSCDLALNVTAPVRLARAALPRMLAAGAGGVVNVSSLVSDMPMPRMATYGATKAFIDSWTRSLGEELRGTGVTVTCVRPGHTRTEFHARAGEPVDGVKPSKWHTPAEVALAGMNAHERGRTLVCVPNRPRLLRIAVNRAARLLNPPRLRQSVAIATTMPPPRTD